LRIGDLLVNRIVIDESRAFNFGEFVDGKPKQKLPKSFANHVEELADFEERCSSTCHRIFRLLAMGLDVRAFLSFDCLPLPTANDA
jgi:isopenicillin N synthase-like dioxygenase